MNKSILEKFIDKYNLGGTIEAVTLEASDDGSLSTKFISDDKSLIGFIKGNEIGIEEGVYPIYDTAKLRSLLAVLEEDIRVKVNKNGNKIFSLLFGDGKTKVTFILADPAVVPKAPAMKKSVSYDLTISLDAKFISTFVRAKNALSEVNTFAIVTTKDNVEIVLGHSSNNINKVTFAVEADQKKIIEPIRFSAKDMRDILVANKEATAGKMEISESGLAHISFTVEDFEVDYYLVQSQQGD